MNATIPYVKGTSERIARILRPHDNTVAHKPSTTLRDVPTRVNDPSHRNSRAGAVYKIPCAECSSSYVSKPRQKQQDSCSSYANTTSNELGRSHLSGICTSGLNERMFLESWHTKSDSNTSIDVCRDMPGSYYSLIAIERARAEFKHTRKQSRNVSSDAR